jgi:hypothetical protein
MGQADAKPGPHAQKLLEALGGPPDPVYIADARYASMSACRPHSCIEKGFLWVDTKSGAGLGVYALSGALLLGSNSLTSDGIPPAARSALIDWLSDHQLASTSVEFIGRDGQRKALDPAPFQPRAKFIPPAGGPAFDCKSAAGPVDKAICENASLAKLDLDMAELTDRIYLGNSTAPARRELVDLQAKWRQQRDSDCKSAEQLAACYRTQLGVLNNWIPRKIP